MKRMKVLKFLGSIGIAIVLFVSSIWTLPVAADDSQDESAPSEIMNNDGEAAGSKISSSLLLHIKKKIQAQSNGGDLSSSQADLSDMKVDGTDVEATNYEKVFLYFDQFPTDSQLNDLESLGVRAYPDTWIPPVGNHPAGFVMADMPLHKLSPLAEKDYLVKMDTAEKEFKPNNNLARAAIGVESVWPSENNPDGVNGAGVTVAVLDSGIDTSSPDFPALNSSNSKDYSNYDGTPGSLDDTLNNTITGHGTHVAGSVLGRGVKSSTYKGVAPGADLVFLKIGKDNMGYATTQAIVGAITAAVDVYQADIITMSYGGWSAFHDGSDAESQAVDYAVSKGTAVFISAGNEAGEGWHYSGTVNANSTSAKIPIIVAENNYSYLYTGLVWYDGQGTNNQLRLQYYNSANVLLSPESGEQSESPRGTECIEYEMSDLVSPGTYSLKVQNLSSSSQFFHIYYYGGSSGVTFSKPVTNYTLGSPAEADGAIAVGAYTTRTAWTDYGGEDWKYEYEKVNSIGTFSSQGPRVDNAAPQKPEIVAPGVGIISVRDNDVYPLPPFYDYIAYEDAAFIIDNNGVNLNGSGPADYFVMSGTSMACPIAAGVGALILSEHPEYTPAMVKSALELTATDKGGKGFDNVYGWGLINAYKAVNLSDIQITTTSLSDGDAKSNYPEQTILTAEGVAPCKWSVKTGKLPKGLTLKASKTDSTKGVISGKPSVSGSFPFTIQVTDSTGAGSEQEYTININPAITLTPPKPNPGEVGIEFPAWTPIVTGGSSSYFWRITKGELPGLVLDNATGVISGIPTAAGSFNVTLTVKDSVEGSASKSITFKIYKELTITTTSLPDAEIGVPYKTKLKATGGTGKYTWTVVSGLPNGLSLDDKGSLSGTPANDITSAEFIINESEGGSGGGGGGGGSGFVVQVEDTLKVKVDQSISLNIYQPPVISGLPVGVVNEAYTHVLCATGGKSPYKFSLTSKNLPSWLKYNSKTCTLSGTPTVAGDYTIKNVKVTDSLKGTVPQDLILKIESESEPLTVIRVIPGDGDIDVNIDDPVQVEFSEAINYVTLNETSYFLKNGASTVLATVSYDADSKTATLIPETDLESSTTYTATITTDVQSSDGKSLASEKTWSFTTTNADTTPPEVESISPADEAGDIALNTTIYAVFSEELDESAINSSSFTLKKGNSLLNGTITYDSTNKAVTFKPSNNLTANTTFTVTVKATIVDAAGNPLASDYVWSFTTGGSGNITSVNVIAPSTVTKGNEFTVEIRVSNVSDLVSSQLRINYDNSVIELVDSQQYAGGIEDGMVGAVVFTPSWYLDDSEDSKGPDKGSIRWASESNLVKANGQGYLAKLHFKALKAGYTTLDFTDAPRSGHDPRGFINKLFDNYGYDISFERMDGEVTVNAS